MKLEKNMYVRTKWGHIYELININDFREPTMKYGVEANYLRDVMFIGDADILKASHNIIDLIEVGDYINGYKITSIEEGNRKNKWVYAEDKDGCLIESFAPKKIKSIVTKEQFESSMYKVGE